MKGDDLKKRTGSDLRAQAAERLAHLADPNFEAKQHEKAFLKDLAGAKEHYAWIVANQAWTQLGFGTYTAWFTARVHPILLQLGARPSPELAADIIDHSQREAPELPAAQRATQAQVAELAGVSKRTVQRRTQDPPPATLSPGSDLENKAKSPVVEALTTAIEGVAANQQKSSPGTAVPVDGVEGAADDSGSAVPSDSPTQAAAEPSAAGEPTPRQSGPDSPAGPVDACDVDGSGTQAGPGKSTADTVAGPVAGTGTADLSVPATPKDAPGMDGGQPDPVPADSPAGRDLQGPSDAKPGVANGRPETDHRDHEPGDETGPEAPSPDNASGPVAGRDPASNGFTGVRPFPVAALGKGATGGEAVGSGGDTPVLPSDPADALHAVAKLFAAIDLETYGPWQSDERIDRMSWDAQQITGAVQTIAMFQSGLTLDGSPS